MKHTINPYECIIAPPLNKKRYTIRGAIIHLGVKTPKKFRACGAKKCIIAPLNKKRYAIRGAIIQGGAIIHSYGLISSFSIFFGLVLTPNKP